MVSVRTLIEKPELGNADAYRYHAGAEWIEREIHEMLGVNFIGHPNLKQAAAARRLAGRGLPVPKKNV